MSSTYTKHYQDSVDRKTENNDVVRRLLIVDNNLANISQGVNALGTSNVGNAIAALDVQIGLIPRTNYSSNFSAVGNQLTRIENTANAIPTYNASNGVAQLIGGQSNQAIVIGGISSDTQAIRNNDIPRLATGNQANALSSSIASGRNESNAIPRNTYNAQLANIQTGVNNIPVQTYNVALGNIQTTTNTVLTNTNNIPRANHSNQLTAIQNSVNAIPTNVYTSNFTTVNTKLDNLSTQVSSISSSGGGGASGTVTLNLTSLIVPFNVNNAGLDLLWCLGAGDLGYVNPNPSRITVSASSDVQGLLTDLTGRNNSDWASNNVANQWVMFDFGFSSSIRKAMIKTIGLQGRSNLDTIWATLLIEGSNNLTTWITLLNWNTGGHDSLQWKYTSFTNNIFYRYLRINQLALNASGNNYLGLSEIRLYGTIDNP